MTQFNYSEAEIAELQRKGAVVTPHPVRVEQYPAGLKGFFESDAPVTSKKRGQMVKSSPKVANSATPVTGPSQSLWIPNWTPTLMNQLAAKPRHWSVSAKLKKSDRDIVAVYARHVTEATGPRRVSIMLVLPKGKKCPDEDSLEKSTWDALVQCKRLVNDTPKWCRRGLPPSYARAIGAESAVGTLILLEDVA